MRVGGIDPGVQECGIARCVGGIVDRIALPRATSTQKASTLAPFDLAATLSTAREAAIHSVIDMMACKAAVKAGERLTPEEIARLLESRERIERSTNCPHGRPTSLRIPLREIEKRFGR